jgi:hypothetical protein
MCGRLKRAAELGMLGTSPVLPGFAISQITTTPKGDYVQQKKERGETFEVPTTHAVRGISAYVDSDGREIGKWIKTSKTTEIDWEAVLKNAFDGYEGRAKPAINSDVNDKDLLNLIPCNDWHANLLCWHREVGEDWDLSIAEDKIGTAITNVIARTPSAGTAVVLVGGDLLHADNNMNRTEASGNPLDTDGRYEKGLEVAQRLMVRTIDAALLSNDKVVVRVLPGNHDRYSSTAVRNFLSAWYRSEQRVSVDTDISLFWFYGFGSVYLGATHGHTLKAEKIPGLMAARNKELWGVSNFRYAHMFHVHHRSKVLGQEGNGVYVETHAAPIPADAWHYGAGYVSARNVQTITYHREFGEYSRRMEAVQ